MNLFLIMIVLHISPKEPQIYFLNGQVLVKLGTITMANVGAAELKFFVDSPFEVESARVDSAEVPVCIPEMFQRKALGLRGRWYIITWTVHLSVGSKIHTIWMCGHIGKTYKRKFAVEVEGTKKLYKPTDVLRRKGVHN